MPALPAPCAFMVLSLLGCRDPVADKDSNADSGIDTHSDSGIDTHVDAHIATPLGMHFETGIEPSTPAELDPYEEPSVYLDPFDLVPGGQATVIYQGELAAKKGVTLEYGFNGWQAVDGPKGFIEEEDDSGYAVFHLDAEMTRRKDGAFEAIIEVPADTRALHMVFRADKGDDSGDEGARDDNDGWEYHWAHTFPYIGPFLTWNDSVGPSDGIVVNYETSVPCLGVVAYGLTDEPDRLAAGDEKATMHHIALRGLEADTRYYYRVYESTGLVSELHSFRTASTKSPDLKILAMADMQDTGSGVDAWVAVAAEATASQGDADVLYLAGDMTCNDKPGFWWLYFDAIRELFASVPQVPAIGNHDTPLRSSSTDHTRFFHYFDLPSVSGSEAVYRVDVGPTRLFVLDSEIPEEFARPDGIQFAWMRDQLESVEESPEWVFAAWHEPPYDAGRRFFDKTLDTRAITCLFDGRVDWVVTGHEHIYQRMKPIRYDAVIAPSGAYGRGPDDGVGYLVLPTAGDNPFDGQIVRRDQPGSAAIREMLAFPEPSPRQDFVPTEIGFTTFEIAGSSLTITNYGMGRQEAVTPLRVVEQHGYTK